MYNILVFGTGQASDLLLQSLDMGRCSILAYFDNDSNKWGGGD